MNQQLRTQAWIRMGLFVVLGLFALRGGIVLAIGAHAAAVAPTLVIAAGLVALCGWIARRIYKAEVALPEPGTLRFPGGANTTFGELFLDLVAGALLMVTIYMLLAVPEQVVAREGNDTGGSLIGFALFFGFFGVVLVLVRRVVWELRPGQPIVRYWSRWLGKGIPMSSGLSLYWEHYYGGPQHNRVVVAWCLKGKAGKKELEIAIVSLDTSEAERQRMLEAWQAAINGTARGAVQAEDRNPYLAPVSATLPT